MNKEKLQLCSLKTDFKKIIVAHPKEEIAEKWFAELIKLTDYKISFETNIDVK